jgi:hypothetical protein
MSDKARTRLVHVTRGIVLPPYIGSKVAKNPRYEGPPSMRNHGDEM